MHNVVNAIKGAWKEEEAICRLESVSYHSRNDENKRVYIKTIESGLYEFLPQAVPRVDLPIIQVILLTGVEHKLSFMGAVFLLNRQ